MTLGPIRVMGAGVVVMMCVEEVGLSTLCFQLNSWFSSQQFLYVLPKLFLIKAFYLKSKGHNLFNYVIKGPLYDQHMMISWTQEIFHCGFKFT